MDTLSKSLIKCKQYFKTRYTLEIPEDWLNQCIEFALEESPGSQIEETVFQQLCDFDMCDIESSSLPKKIIQTDSGTIEGVFLVQVSFVVDATESYFNKIQKVLGQINENALVDADNVPGATQFERRFDKKARLLTIFLTDGSISVKAIEHQHIPILTEDILPGRKILLKGRIQYQNRVLMLKPENLELLDGFVEGITNSEHFVELLQNELEAKRKPSGNREISQSFTGLSIKSKDSKLKNYQQSNLKDEDDLLEECDFDAMIKNPQVKRAPSSDAISAMQKQRPSDHGKKPKQQTIIDSDEEDNLLLQGDFINKVESVAANKNVLVANKNIQNNSKTNKVGDMAKTRVNKIQEVDFNDKKKYKCYEDMMDFEEVTFEKAEKSKEIKKCIDNSNNVIVNVRNIEVDMEPVKKIEPLTAFTKKKEFLENCCLLNQPTNSSQLPNYTTCHHLVKCTIETLTDRLKQYKLKWYQDCRIKDTKSIVSMDVYLGDTPMTKLLGLTVAQVKEKYLQKQSDDYDRAKVECDRKLQKICCVMHLKYDLEKQKFCVWDIED